MSDPKTPYAKCSLLVVRVTQTQIMGDTVADGLRDQLLSLYDDTGAMHVILDMQAVTYLASTGIRPLLAMNKKVRERQGRFILCCLHDEVRGVLAATRLISSSSSAPATFETRDTVPEAVASLYS